MNEFYKKIVVILYTKDTEILYIICNTMANLDLQSRNGFRNPVWD